MLKHSYRHLSEEYLELLESRPSIAAQPLAERVHKPLDLHRSHQYTLKHPTIQMPHSKVAKILFYLPLEWVIPNL